MRIRDATPSDAAAIAVIYNDAVENTTAIWNDAVVDEADRAAWIRARQETGYPVLVAVGDGDEVVAYATFGDFRAFDGYRHTVEHSVYVRSDQRGNGLGERLMVELISRARDLGKHVMIAAIEASNTQSIRLHERLGFVHGGTLTQVGRKFDRWLDLAFMQFTLDEPVAGRT